MLGHTILTHIICLLNSKLMAKLKDVNHRNKIICERSFKNLLKLNNIFSQNLSFKGLLRLELLLIGSSTNLLNLSSKIKKRLIEGAKASNLIRARKDCERELFFNAFRIAGDGSLFGED